MTEAYAGELALFPDGSVGVGGGGPGVVIETLDAVAAHVRTDERGRYRPLSGARTLPRGWRCPARSADEREAAIEAVYPLAVTHQKQFTQRTLRVVSLDEVLTRQSGRYENTSALSGGGRQRAASLVCGECVRTPVWDGGDCQLDSIPCPEPCSVLVAFCREAALWEADAPASSEPDSAVAWAAFEEPGNELRERYLSTLERESE